MDTIKGLLKEGGFLLNDNSIIISRPHADSMQAGPFMFYGWRNLTVYRRGVWVSGGFFSLGEGGEGEEEKRRRRKKTRKRKLSF